MYSHEEFQATNQSVQYAGRKIRMARNEEEVIEPTTSKKEEVVKEEKPQTLEKSSFNAESQEKSEVTSNNEPKAKLIRSLERNLRDDKQNHLIAVFGINSDVVLREALEEVRNNTFTNNFISLPKSIIVGDVFQTFATMIYGMIKNDMRFSDLYARRQIFHYISKICPNESEIDSLEAQMLRANRAENCKELLKLIKQTLSLHDFKFVWNIEVGITEHDRDFLAKLSHLVFEDLIVVVNYLKPISLEADLLTADYGECASQSMGHQLLQKYIWYDDIIETE